MMTEFKKISDDELKTIYLEWVSKEINELQSLLKNYATKDLTAGAYAANLKSLSSIFHNIKGMGGSFGFDLMTDIGTSLSHYLMKLEGKAHKIDVELVEAHVDTIKMIIDNSIMGDGGEKGQAMLQTLQSLIEDEML